MRRKNATNVIAVVASDLHLSHTPPIARTVEPNWYDAMDRALLELIETADYFDVPILLAGDIFDHWKQPPELINHLIEILTYDNPILAIPGQHDMPFHSMQDLHKSAYMTLCKTGNITNVPKPYRWYTSGTARPVEIHPFPYGASLEPLQERKKGVLYIALVHHYCWKPGYNHAGAEPFNHYANFFRYLKGYNTIITGDNHKPFEEEAGSLLFNCGTLMRRKADEVNYTPRIGLLHEDGGMTSVELNSSKEEKFLQEDQLEDLRSRVDLEQFANFLQDLQRLDGGGVEFHDTLRRYVRSRKVSREVSRIIWEIIG